MDWLSPRGRGAAVVLARLRGLWSDLFEGRAKGIIDVRWVWRGTVDREQRRAHAASGHSWRDDASGRTDVLRSDDDP